jgi:predicted permease
MLNLFLQFWRRLLFYMRRDRFDRELEEEMRFHMEMKAGENLAAGMSLEESRYASQRQFGNRTFLQEVSREMWGFRSIETLVQDLRYGARMLLKHKSFTAVAVLTLALGIGANSAIFSVVNSVLLRELPYREPERLVMIYSDRPLDLAKTGWTEVPVSPGEFLDLRDRNQSFEQLAAFQPQGRNITSSDEPEFLGGVRATSNLFAVLGLEARLGRVFLPEDEQPGNNLVVILSDGLWQRRFGADPKIIGQKIAFNNEPYTVIGVMPPDLQFPPKTVLPTPFQIPGVNYFQFYIPLTITPDQRSNRSGSLAVIARLKPQIRFEQAQADAVGIARWYEQQYPDTHRNRSLRLMAVHQQVVGKAQTALLALLGATGVLLLIACVNIANLLLARGAARQKEMAVRAALGAGRWRVIRQLLTESLLLAVLAGAVASLLAFWGVDLLRTMVPDGFPRAEEIGVDLRFFGFTLAVSLLTGIIFGLIPALQGSRTDLNETLKEGGRSSGGGRRNRFGGLLVVSEVALALLLLAGAGLMLRSFIRLMNVDPGFDPQNVLTMGISLPENKYQHRQAAAFFQQLLERVRSLPGVRSADLAWPLPLSGGGFGGTGFMIDGKTYNQGDMPYATIRTASPDYFKTMRIQLLKGRFFTEGDAHDSPSVMIINETMARRYWTNEDPIGRRIYFNWNRSRPEIVGVVKDIRHAALDAEPKPHMYFPFVQLPSLDAFLVARTDGDPLSLVAAVRGEVQAIDKDQPVVRIRTMEELVSESASQRRFNMLLLAVFAGVALIMASVGIYGVMSYSVEQRTHEIGLRMALGAQTADVLRMLLGQGMKMVVMGVAIGLAAASAMTRLISRLLFGVSATDPVTYVAIALLLAAVALLACYLPARRAAKVDPVEALRSE